MMVSQLKKRNFPKISSGTVKSLAFIVLVGSALAFWLYTQRIYYYIREFQNAVVKTQVQVYLTIIDPRSSFDSGIPSELFENVIRKAPYPIIFTDEDLNPKQGYWHNVGIDPADTTKASHEKLRNMVRKMDKVNPPERYPILGIETLVDTLTVYEMPIKMKLPVLVTDRSGKLFYARNTAVDLSDTAAVHNAVRTLDSRASPVLFRKHDEQTLVFHSLQARGMWPVVVVKNGREPLYWNDAGVTPYDTTAAGREKITGVISEISRNGIVYEIVGQRDIEVERTELFHYGDLPFLMLIGWMPVIELVVILILFSIGFIGFMNIKNAEQRSIWVGMAKETAHQLGTPISSLNGWFELLKTEQNTEMLNQALPDMEYDVKRLTKVAERFSNVGSVPELKPTNLSDVIEELLDYFSTRVPRMGKSVSIKGHYEDLKPVMGNHELLNWAFENMIKNSLSAIESRTKDWLTKDWLEGKIVVNVTMSKDLRHVIIDFKDNGKGIVYADQKKIMKPGFTTKKRGWGLGLSLVKRIIDDYHGGKVYLLESGPGEGTTFRVILPAIK